MKSKAHQNYYRPGLEKGWALAKEKKLPPKPCLVCGEDVFYKKSAEKRAKYCSLKCKYKDQKGKKLKTTRIKTGKSFKCEVCGKPFYRMQSEIKRKTPRFCSISCRKNGNYSSGNKGENNIKWKGGTTKIKGYIYVKSYNHPFKNSNDYVAQHRLVMEKYIGRYLNKKECVHHRNGIKDDNRIGNLEIVSVSPHIGNIKCPHCGKEFTIR